MADLQYKYIAHFGKGINRHLRSDVIDDSELYNTKNIKSKGGVLEIRKGYLPLTVPLSDGTVSDVEETMRKVYELELSDGTSKVIGFSTHNAYLYNLGIWSPIQRSTGAVFTAIAGSTFTSAAHGLSNDDLVKTITDNTLPTGLVNSVAYYVVNKTANTFELSLSSGGVAITVSDAGVGNHSFIPCFLGVVSLPFKVVTYTPLDAAIFTNSVEPPFIYTDDGPGYEIRPLGGLTGGAPIGTSTAVTKCRDLAVWKERLWMFYTTEDGNDLPQQIRWSDVADIENWSKTSGTDGGYLRLSDRDDPIQKALQLGQDMIIYRDHSIVRGTYVGSAQTTVRFFEVVSEEGAIGPNAVADAGDFHIVMGWTNIYKYQGGAAFEPIGTKVQNLIYGTEGLMDLDRSVDINLKHITSLKEVWCSVLVGTQYGLAGSYTAFKSLVFIYSIIDDNWSIFEFGDATVDIRIADFANVRVEASLAWDETESNWEDAGDLTWDSQAFQTEFPSILMSSKSDILEYNHVTSQDDGEDIDFEFETKDFAVPKGFIRVELVELDTEGGGCSVFYSVDRGVTYVSMGTIGSNSTLKRDQLYADVSCNLIRFKVSGTGGGFKGGSIGFSFIEDSES